MVADHIVSASEISSESQYIITISVDPLMLFWSMEKILFYPETSWTGLLLFFLQTFFLFRSIYECMKVCS